MEPSQKTLADYFIHIGAAIIGVLLTIVGVLVGLTFSDLKTEIKDQTKSTWEAIRATDKSVSELTNNVAKLGGTVENHISNDKEIHSDHEQRIRTIERKVDGPLYNPH